MLERFFHELLSDRLPACHPETRLYVVSLLVSMAADPGPDEPLVLLVLGEGRSLLTLQRAGDWALFVAGFFPEHAARVSCSYYERLGSAAYGELSARFSPAMRPVFGELADRFVAFERALRRAREGLDRGRMESMERRLLVSLD